MAVACVMYAYYANPISCAKRFLVLFCSHYFGPVTNEFGEGVAIAGAFKILVLPKKKEPGGKSDLCQDFVVDLTNYGFSLFQLFYQLDTFKFFNSYQVA